MMGLTLQAGGNESSSGTRARILPGVVLIDEPIPVDHMTWLSDVLGEGSVIDTSLARWAGACLAFRQSGPAADAARERFRLKYREQIAASVYSAGLADGIADWLASDDVGASSMAILHHLSEFRDPLSGADWPITSLPADAADLRRCRLLIEHDDGTLWGRFSDMDKAGEGWARLVQGWDDVCEVMDSECQSWRDQPGPCPETNSFLRALLNTPAPRS